MPLQLAFAITIHRCQGMEAGKDPGDRWRRMVIDPGDTLWEISMNSGTQYVATSRAKDFGSKDELYPKDSCIYWTGTNISVDRIHNCTRKRNGELCAFIQKRAKFLQHLSDRAAETKSFFDEAKINNILNNTYQQAVKGDLITDKDDLKKRISDMIRNPNPTWQAHKMDYQQQRTFFDHGSNPTV